MHFLLAVYLASSSRSLNPYVFHLHTTIRPCESYRSKRLRPGKKRFSHHTAPDFCVLYKQLELNQLPIPWNGIALPMSYVLQVHWDVRVPSLHTLLTYRIQHTSMSFIFARLLNLISRLQLYTIRWNGQLEALTSYHAKANRSRLHKAFVCKTQTLWLPFVS